MKLQNWRRKTESENICMVERLSEYFENLDTELDNDSKIPYVKLLRNPFSTSSQAISDSNGRAQDELIDLIHDRSAKELFEREVLRPFGAQWRIPILF